ncbi:hypothetical protein ACJX0J_011408, partial [Zea mays]
PMFSSFLLDKKQHIYFSDYYFTSILSNILHTLNIWYLFEHFLHIHQKICPKNPSSLMGQV